MSLATTEVRFLSRFEQIWAALRRHQVRQGLGWSVLTAALGVGLLAWADYRLELTWTTRAAGLAAAAIAVLVVLWRAVFEPMRWWTQPRTAIEIEQRFPQLGQRIRTVVQYAGLTDEAVLHEGVTPSLVDALGIETEFQTKPLALDEVIPRRRTWVVGTLAALPVLGILGGVAVNPEWRTALSRAFLNNTPYTQVAVVPGDTTIEQGKDVAVAVELRGRARRDVVLYTRPKGGPDPTWKAIPLDAPAKGPASKRATTLEKVRDPVEYRAVAGPDGSRTHLIDVRYPLKIKSFNVVLTPPSYTGLKPTTVKGGDLRALEGTGARFRLTFDASPVEAKLVLIDPAARAKGKAAPAPTVIPLKADGDGFAADLPLAKDLEYRIEAQTCSSCACRTLAERRHRIDVFEDRAPRVAFDEPDEALEVHAVAEVKNRVRVSDDYGLARAGIVFRFNDGEEKTLLLRDFPAKEKDGLPRLSGALEEMLLMETLAASPTDSVTYFAFAEDNFPGAAHRTETDLRYIDIRPFKRIYKPGQDGDGGDEDQPSSASLEELIARQRVNLNRTNRLAKHRGGDKSEPEDPLKVAGFEEALATLTREFTEGIEQIVDQRVESLHKAEEAMLAAVDSLDHRRYTDAGPQESEALKHLIQFRREFATIIGKPTPAQLEQLRKFDRKQAQKIRRPKGKDEEAEEIAAEIEELAQEDDFQYASLGGLMVVGGDEPADSPAGKAGDEPKDPKDAEPKDAKADKTEAAKDGMPAEPKDAAGLGGKGGKGPKGKDGKASKGDPAKGEPTKDGQPGQAEDKDGPDGRDEAGKDGPGTKEKRSPGAEGDDPKAKDGPGAKGDDPKGKDGAGDDPKGKDGAGDDPKGKDGAGDDPKGKDGAGDDPKGKDGAGDKARDNPKGKDGRKGSKKAPGMGRDEDEQDPDGAGGGRKPDRRALADRQQGIADRARELEDQLKKLEVVSDLAKARMAKAAGKAEQAAGALARGNTKEAAEATKSGAGVLHEVARQVKGEVTREVAEELAMARDLAEELARREAELGELPGDRPNSGLKIVEPGKKGTPGDAGKGDEPGKAGQAKGSDPKDGKEAAEGKGKGPDAKDGKEGQDASGKGQGEKEGEDGEAPGTKGQGKGPGPAGRGPLAGMGGLSEGERMERLADAARTLEAWLKQIDGRGEEKASEEVGKLIEKGKVAEVIQKMDRVGELRLGGQQAEAVKEAREAAGLLEAMSQTLDGLHREIVAPQLAALTEFDRRVADLTAKLKTMETDAQVAEWHREAGMLIRELEKNDALAGATADLTAALEAAEWKGTGGAWHFGGRNAYWAAPVGYAKALQVVALQIQEKMQEMILKDLVAARDEVTPPEYKEMVERYYEVLSKNPGKK